MADNVFQHNKDGINIVSSVVTTTESSPTTSPIHVATTASSHAIQMSPTLLYFISYLLFLVLALGLIATTRMLRPYCCKHRRLRKNGDTTVTVTVTPGGDDNDNDNDNDNDIDIDIETQNTTRRSPRHSAHETISVVALNIKDRIRLYQRTFDRNKHYHTLTPTDFHPIYNNKNKNKKNDCDLDDRDIESSGETVRNLEHENEADEYDEDPSKWIYLSFTSSTLPTSQTKKYSPHKGELYDTWDTDAAVTSFDTCETAAATSFDSTESNSDATTTPVVPTAQHDYVPPTKLPGTCIICFEDFCVGETVVWSDDPTTCKHVYHEDCMVRFLATHSHRTKNTNHRYDSAAVAGNQENPCPTCRQKFCTVFQQDLLMSVLLKSVEVALDEQQEHEQHHSGRETMRPTSSSERSERIVAASFALASPIWERTSESIFSVAQQPQASPGNDSFDDDRPMDHT